MTPKVVVLDDDPTGTQTVTGVTVLTRWTIDDLTREVQSPEPAFFLLTNSRALPEAEAVALAHTIGRDLAMASERAGREIRVISRGDSTLRGHFPAEVDALMDGLGGEFTGIILCPYFEEGGRLTINGVHYVVTPDGKTPVGETEFARDRTFGFRSSNLVEWVREKSGGHRSRPVVSVNSADGFPTGEPGTVYCVDAANESDLAQQVEQVRVREGAGERFVYRTAASWVGAYAGIGTRSLVPLEAIRSGKSQGGLIVVGSYVEKTNRQLSELRALGLPEVVVQAQHLDDPESALRLAKEIGLYLAADQSVILSTFRETDRAGDLNFGKLVSQTLVAIVANIQETPSYLVTKGGITSSDIVTEALGVRQARVLGPVMPGVPAWRAGENSHWPGISIVIFPGNVGTDHALRDLVSALDRSA